MSKLKIKTEVENIVGFILEDYKNGKEIDRINIFNKPDKEKVIEIVNKLTQIIFPGYFREEAFRICIEFFHIRELQHLQLIGSHTNFMY